MWGNRVLRSEQNLRMESKKKPTLLICRCRIALHGAELSSFLKGLYDDRHWRDFARICHQFHMNGTTRMKLQSHTILSPLGCTWLFPEVIRLVHHSLLTMRLWAKQEMVVIDVGQNGQTHVDHTLMAYPSNRVPLLGSRMRRKQTHNCQWPHEFTSDITISRTYSHGHCRL